MVATILLRAGQDPTIACGGDLLAVGTATPAWAAARISLPRPTSSTAPSSNSLRKYEVITNIEADHLDLYGTMEALWRRSTSSPPQGTSC